MPRARVGRVAATVAALVALAGGAALWAGSAFACTNLATISLSAAAGHPGDRIVVIGTSFPVSRTMPPTPVVLRWGTTDGHILAEAVPDRTGTVSATFTVPQGAPGNVLIVAVQRRGVIDPAAPEKPPTTFVDEIGTPARASFRLLALGERAPAPAASSSIGQSGDAGSTGLIVLMVLFGAVALSLFAGGLIAFLHQLRSRKPTPQPAAPRPLPPYWG